MWPICGGDKGGACAARGLQADDWPHLKPPGFGEKTGRRRSQPGGRKWFGGNRQTTPLPLSSADVTFVRLGVIGPTGMYTELDTVSLRDSASAATEPMPGRATGAAS